MIASNQYAYLALKSMDHKTTIAIEHQWCNSVTYGQLRAMLDGKKLTLANHTYLDREFIDSTTAIFLNQFSF